MQKKTMGVLALILIGLVASMGIVSAFGGGFGLDSESREAIKQAVEAGDYEAWKEAMSNTLTQENFNKLVERHKTMSEKRELMKEHREAVEAAIESNDYDAWKEAMEELERPRITKIITEENFDTFVELHEARKNGDFETVKELSEELGLKEGFGMRRMPYR